MRCSSSNLHAATVSCMRELYFETLFTMTSCMSKHWVDVLQLTWKYRVMLCASMLMGGEPSAGTPCCAAVHPRHLDSSSVTGTDAAAAWSRLQAIVCTLRKPLIVSQ